MGTHQTKSPPCTISVSAHRSKKPTQYCQQHADHCGARVGRHRVADRNAHRVEPAEVTGMARSDLSVSVAYAARLDTRASS
jgi:hypothetical protein